MKLAVAVAAVVAAVLIGVLGAMAASGRFSSSPTSPAVVAGQIGGEATCVDTGYLIHNRLDDSQDEIYSCYSRTRGTMCVTSRDGVATDATVLARLAFADSLNGKPDCV